MNQFEDLELVAHIQIGGGLVQKKHLGILGQGHGNPHPLLLAAGQLCHRLVLVFDRVGDLQSPADLLLVLLGVAGQTQGMVGGPTISHQLLYGQVWGGGVVLVDDGHLFGKVLQPKMGDVLPPELDFPLVWFQIFGHQVE